MHMCVNVIGGMGKTLKNKPQPKHYKQQNSQPQKNTHTFKRNPLLKMEKQKIKVKKYI